MEEMQDDIDIFFRNFDRLMNSVGYGDCVNFAYRKILELPDVVRVRYGNNERYCVYVNHLCKIAVLAQSGRYERKCDYISIYSLQLFNIYRFIPFQLLNTDSVHRHGHIELECQTQPMTGIKSLFQPCKMQLVDFLGSKKQMQHRCFQTTQLR